LAGAPSTGVFGVSLVFTGVFVIVFSRKRPEKYFSSTIVILGRFLKFQDDGGDLLKRLNITVTFKVPLPVLAHLSLDSKYSII
jgi:hypothetical protein